VKVRLEKRIPVGGGLGGGSSDAAAMLRGLDTLFGLGLGAERLAELARPLGSDVPFLVRGGSAVVEGLGERLQAAAVPVDTHAVLVLPEASCPTGPVYRAFDALRPAASLQPDRVHAMARRAEAPARHEPFNDLAEPAFAVAGSLRVDQASVQELVQRPVHVSGSGSTLFFLCDGPVEGELLADAVTRHAGMPALPVRAIEGPEPAWKHRPRS